MTRLTSDTQINAYNTVSDAVSSKPGSPPDAPLAELDLSDLVSMLRRHARYLCWGAALGGLIAVGVTLVLPRTYSATGAFVPQSTDGGSTNLSGLAAQFGLTVGNSQNAGDSPLVYAELLQSREILEPVVSTVYKDKTGTHSLAELTDVRFDSPTEREDAAIRKLRDMLHVSVDKETGVIHFEVQATSAVLAQQIASRLLAVLNDYNLSMRQEMAGAERTFVGARVAEAENELHNRENALLSFLLENRQYQGDPRLLVEHDRLQRQVDIQQQVYSSLAQSYAQVRLNAVRNTPVVMVLERPTAPVRPDPRRTPLRALLGAILGALAGFGFGAFRQRRVTNNG